MVYLTAYSLSSVLARGARRAGSVFCAGRQSQSQALERSELPAGAECVRSLLLRAAGTCHRVASFGGEPASQCISVLYEFKAR